MVSKQRRSEGTRALRLLLELLRPQGPRRCHETTADDLRVAAELAFGHGLFLLFDRGIREQAAAFTTAQIAGEYERTARPLRVRHISHALRHERVEQDVLALLDAAAVPSVILKGSALSRDLYGDPHCRTSVDIDLLVHPGDVPAADTALRDAGYRRDNDRPLAFWMRRLHHAVYQRPGSLVPVEIHWNFSIPGFFNLDPEEIWAGVEREGLRGRLTPAMNLTLLLMHHHTHWCGDLRTLVDLVWACDRHREELDSCRWPQHLERTGLLVVAGIARLQAESLWGALHLWDLGKREAHHGLRVGLLTGAAGLALDRGRRSCASERFRHLLVHRLALDSPRRVLASITKTLLPSVDDMRALNVKERVGLAEYVRYFRWRFGGRASGNEEQVKSQQ